jgi:hypothetical protein
MNFFIGKCEMEHLRKSARVCIKENEARDVASSRAGTSKSGSEKKGREAELKSRRES